jgi:hypothetical protein
LIVVVQLVLTGLAVALVLGHGPWSGDKLVEVTYNHGVNTGDVPIAAAWLVATGCLLALWRRQ